MKNLQKIWHSGGFDILLSELIVWMNYGMWNRLTKLRKELVATTQVCLIVGISRNLGHSKCGPTQTAVVGLIWWRVHTKRGGAPPVVARYINQKHWMDCVKTTQNIASKFYGLKIAQLSKFKYIYIYIYSIHGLHAIVNPVSLLNVFLYLRHFIQYYNVLSIHSCFQQQELSPKLYEILYR